MATSLSLRVRQAQVFRFSQTADLLRLSSQELGEHLSVLASENPMLIPAPPGARCGRYDRKPGRSG